jgi:hypothetical protein
MVAVFLLRTDSVTDKREGEVYYIKKLGLVITNFWNSPKLIDNQVIVANGKKAIDLAFDEYSNYHITEAVIE